MASVSKVMTIPKATVQEQMSAFRRKRDALVFGWANVDPALMYAAMASAIECDIAIMFSRAAGGRGVCIRLLKGKNVPSEVEYAMDAEELNGWLEAIVDAYGSKSEDAVMTMRAQLEALANRKAKRRAAMSAD